MITRCRKSIVLLYLLVAAVLMHPALAADKKPEPITVKDAHYGEILFYFYQEDYFPAIVRLLAAQQQDLLENHGPESELLLGGLYLSYGHHLRAAEIFERLLADSVDPEIRDRTWFFLAKIWHQRGYTQEARAALQNIESKLPKGMEAERDMLLAQLLIDDGQHDEAIALLREWPDKTEWASYAQFNLGVAMVRSGRVNDASAILESIGSMEPYNEELSSLRDKANLALGYAYLQDGQPLAAKPALQRVRLSGPFSNKALLGVGWADAESDNYQRALVPWMELQDRNLLDSAVQESMLAVPYAMAKLDSMSQAADHYVNAIEAFYEESARLEETIDHIESGAMFAEFLDQDPDATTGWNWKLEDLPEGRESRYLMHLLATHEFQEGLKNYRDLSYLLRNLDDWQTNIEVYGNMIETRKIAFERRLPRVEASLSQADLDSMVDRKLQMDARLNSIEQNQDSLGLASEEEFALWGEISAAERHPAIHADLPEAEEVRQKIRLLKGALQWNLDKQFKVRLSQTRRDLKTTGEALVETQRSRRQVDQSLRTEPEVFAEFDSRVGGLSPRIDSLKSEVAASMVRQQAFLQSIAVGELYAQKQRLDTYTVQARFALAAIYDRSNAEGEIVAGDASE